LPLNSLAESTEVLYGTDKVISEELEFFFKTKRQIDTCMEHTRPSLAIGMESIKNSFVDAKSRGMKLRYLTEITDANISYCKELMSIVDEVRHLDGIKGNFMVSEMEYLAPATSHEERKLASLIIYSSVREIVEHQQYVFETLWNRPNTLSNYISDCDKYHNSWTGPSIGVSDFAGIILPQYIFNKMPGPFYRQRLLSKEPCIDLGRVNDNHWAVLTGDPAGRLF
jgi:hypothetical protein